MRNEVLYHIYNLLKTNAGDIGTVVDSEAILLLNIYPNIFISQ